MEGEACEFREVQKIRQWWVWPLVIASCAVPWYGFITQIILGRPFGDRPAPDWLMWVLFFAFGIGLPLFVASVRLAVEVRRDRLWIRFSPLKTREVPFETIRKCYVRQYRPIREYGGWGLKYGFKAGWSYTMGGNVGVQLELADGGKLLVGSQRAEELCAAIGERLPQSS